MVGGGCRWCIAVWRIAITTRITTITIARVTTITIRAITITTVMPAIVIPVTPTTTMTSAAATARHVKAKSAGTEERAKAIAAADTRTVVVAAVTPGTPSTTRVRGRNREGDKRTKCGGCQCEF